MLRVLLLFLLLTGCAARTAPTVPCSRMFVLLPDNYIIDLEAGANVWVNPAAQEIAVFCSPEDARATLKASAPAGYWAVYEVEGEFLEAAELTGTGDYRLVRSSRIADWVPPPADRPG